MRIRGRILTLFAVLWLWPTVAAAQSSAVEEAEGQAQLRAIVGAIKEYGTLITEARYEKALSVAEYCCSLTRIATTPTTRSLRCHSIWWLGSTVYRAATPRPSRFI